MPKIYANLASLNITPSEADKLSFADYQGIIFQNNLKYDDNSKSDPPSLEDFEQKAAMFEQILDAKYANS